MNLGSLFADFGKLEEQSREIRQWMTGLEVVGEAGGGLVRVRMNGIGEVSGVEIDPSLESDLPMVQDFLVTAFADARRKISEAVKKKLGLLGNLLPPGMSF